MCSILFKRDSDVKIGAKNDKETRRKDKNPKRNHKREKRWTENIHTPKRFSLKFHFSYLYKINIPSFIYIQEHSHHQESSLF